MRRIFTQPLLLAFCFVSGPVSTPFAADSVEGGPVEAPPAPGSAAAPVELDLPDSVTQIFVAGPDAPLPMPAVEVLARRLVRGIDTNRIEVGRSLVEGRDGGSIADLAPLLPSTHLSVNSRGEALFMVRGASERHLRIRLDGIPLTLPWDERVDLSVLPLLAIEGVTAQRGPGRVLDAPNTLAGRIDLRSARQGLEGWSTRAGVEFAEVGARDLLALHTRRHGNWSSTLALGRRSRDGFLLPSETGPGLHQPPDRRTRLNSDLEQTSLLLRVARARDEDRELSLLVQAFDADKGVPPEENEADARFWRYRDLRRQLAGVRWRTALGDWRLDAVQSFDRFEQTIERYSGDDYRTADGQEEGLSSTLLQETRLEHRWNTHTTGAIRSFVRWSRHEVDDTDGALVTHQDFEQLLGGLAAEARVRSERGWLLRAGAGYEGADTPETGTIADRAAEHEWAAQVGVEKELRPSVRVHTEFSRRPRFPSMRELFSDALDRFDINPDLDAEIQLAAETGIAGRSQNFEWSLNLFAQQIDDAIERVRLPSGRRRRVNLDAVRHLGAEIGVVVRPARGWVLDLQQTFLRSRARENGAFDAAVEDRPSWIGSWAVGYVHPAGWRLRSEWIGVGPRFSLGDGLERLDADLRWNLRLSWTHFGRGGRYAGSEWFVRVDNVVDARTWSQVGLPESGRTLRLGVRLDLQG